MKNVVFHIILMWMSQQIPYLKEMAYEFYIKHFQNKYNEQGGLKSFYVVSVQNYEM